MLKSLELFGFKSFADRTLFDFSPGITCVVGPNGSGKSNVVDAMKWLLGDQSAKSLRGKDMSDVIFNGSSSRRASGFAEATLTFDNANGLLPIDAHEVQVGRRLYQSGDSEYLLNRSPVRLKDVRDMFMGTGAGTAAYSIIEQGRVDQILQANPATRRLVFEEAAGISKFKSRRVDAERRLERVAQNLLRLTDIVDEVEGQLKSTRNQASKAAKFREVSTELEQLWTGLAADDTRLFTRQVDEKEADIAVQVEQQEIVQSEIDELDEEKQDVDARISDLDDRLLESEREIASTREAIAGRDTTIRHQTQRLSEIEDDLKQQRTQRAILLRRVVLAGRELDETGIELSAFEKQFLQAQGELQERENAVERFEELLQQRRDHVQTLRDEHSELKALAGTLREQLGILKSQADSLAASREKTALKRDTTKEAVSVAQSELDSFQSDLAEAEAAYRETQDTVQSLQSHQSNLLQQREDTERRLNDLRQRRSGAEARRSVLDELETRQEGIAIGVRDILKRADESHYPPWNRVLGLVRDLIDVPMELAPVIEAALGERAQLIAVQELDSLLDYLNRGPAPIEGRVGFVAVDGRSTASQKSDSYEAFSVDVQSSVDLGDEPGVHGRADRLVRDSNYASGLAARVLADTWIVETLDTAHRLLLKASTGTRFVTLQGEVLATDQRLFVGTVPHESSIVSRKSELRQLRNEILQIEKNIEDAIQRQEILANSVTDQTQEMDNISEEIKARSTRVTECATQLSSQEKEVSRLEREYRDHIHQVESIDQDFEKNSREVVSIEQKMADTNDAIETAMLTIESQQAEITEIETALTDTTQAIKAEQLAFAKHEERYRNLKESRVRLETDQQQRQSQLDDINQRLQSTRQLQRTAVHDVLRAESEIASLALTTEGILKATRASFREREQLRQARKQLAKAEESLNKQRRKHSDQQHELQIELQNLKHQLQSLEERIDEEFQLSLDDLTSSNASAYRHYLSEEYGEENAEQILQQLIIQNSSQPAESIETEDDVDLETEEVELVDDVDEFEEADIENAEADESEDGAMPAIEDVPTYEDVRDELEARVDKLRRRIKSMGHVNTDALASLEELETRFTALSHQLKDLEEAKTTLEEIIRRINVESQRIFIETFETIRGHFQELFRKLFGGGDADIILEDPNDVLECGIDIVARPPGKELRSISLLSGGEKTMTAVGMLFAMFKSKPSPYCILDEVDAALDEANVDRYVTVLKEFESMTQFVVITHRKRTMTAAHVLYGVTMEQAGVSKRISVGFEDVNDNGEIRTAA